MKKRKYNIMYPPIGPYDYDNGMEVHLWEDLEVELHQHDYYEFLICIEGKMEHVLNGTRIDVISKRQAVFITPNDVHHIRAVEGYKARHINISVTKEIFHELCFYLKMSNRSNSVTDLDFARVVRLTAQEYKNFFTIFEQLNSFADKGKYLYGYKLKYFLVAVSYAFLSHKQENDDIPEWLLTFVEEISKPKRFGEKLNDLYALSGYSQAALNKYFKKYYNVTMVEYLREIKINYACSLLKTSNLSILDIAIEVGYFALSHFNRIFKDRMGCTPTEYRNAEGFQNKLCK